MTLDNSRFLSQVKIKGALPDGRFTDEEILDLAYEVLTSQIQPFIISFRKEYYVKKSTSAIVSGTASHSINDRALGLVLRELKATFNGQVVDLHQIDPEDVNDNQIGQPDSFYPEGVNLVLYPIPNVSGTLTQSYFQRASKPVLVADTALITDIDFDTGIVTAETPTAWSTSNQFDILSCKNGHDTRAKDLTASSITSTTITFSTSDIPTDLIVGDYVALAGESPFIQVPDEVFLLVVQLTVCELLESMGSLNELGAATAKAEKLKENIVRTMTQRIQGASVKFKPQV